MLVFISLYVMLGILLYISVCAAASLFCACLVRVQVSAPYVIAGSTYELYISISSGRYQHIWMAGLLLKISRCSACVAQPAMIICCIHCSRVLGCCLQPSPLSLRCSSSDPLSFFHRTVLVASIVVIVVFLCIMICPKQSGDG